MSSDIATPAVPATDVAEPGAEQRSGGSRSATSGRPAQAAPGEAAPAPAGPVSNGPVSPVPNGPVPAGIVLAGTVPAATVPGANGSAPTVSAVAVSASQRRRVRDRLAERIVPNRAPVNRPELEPLVAVHRDAHSKADIRILQRAYDVAEFHHRGQLRKSGDPYITHPLAVAMILAELGMDSITLAAALLHDTVEDTKLTIDDLVKEFGSEVAHLVNGVTKLDKVKFGAAAEAETIRKMIVAMSRDPRVLVIKLADRLHNMRTLRFLPPAKQERKARETLDVLAPLAHRLGMNTIKWELEDLSFATLYPKRYDEIVRLVAERAPSRDTYLREVIDRVGQDLKQGGIKATITGRPKHYYSIYQKMIVRGHDFTDIHDLVGIRILVETMRDCYATLGVVHANWQPVPGRFKDYIAMPKFNMYQSLHTTVIGPGGKAVELQIRTEDMHHTAEYGIAAHWKYKEISGIDGGPGAGSDEMAWLRQMLDWQREALPPEEFLDTLRYDLGAKEVFVFTPAGDVLSLPAGSTPVDFAYAVHTEVGHRCVGARVNGKLVALESKLESGNTVEVFTSKAETAGPSRDWLGFVVSPRAKTKIKQWYSKERREDSVETGKTRLTQAMRRAGLPLQRLLGGEALTALAADLGLADVTALYAAVGESQVSAQSVVSRLVTTLGGREGATEDLAEVAKPLSVPGRSRSGGDVGVTVKGLTDVWAKLARCCTPVPGDDILGFVTRGGGVSVHRLSCTNAASLQAQPDRLADVEWNASSTSLFVVSIQVEALDRHRLLSDISRCLAEERVNILSAAVNTDRNRVAVSKFTFEMAEAKHLGHLLRTVKNVEGVYDAYRIHAAS